MKFIRREETLLVILAIGLILFAGISLSAHAQSAGAAAGSSSQSGAAAGAQAGAIGIVINGGGGGTDGSGGAAVSGGTSEGSIGYGVGIGGSSSASNNGSNLTFNSTAVKQRNNTPSVVGGSMTILSNANSCLKSFSAGGSVPGGSLVFGKYYMDKECSRRVNAILVYNMGYRKAALQMHCGNPDVWASFEMMGNSPCLNEKPRSAGEIQYKKRDMKDGDVADAKPKNALKKLPMESSVLNVYPGKTIYDSQTDDSNIFDDD